MAAVLIERCDFDEFLAEKFKRKCEKSVTQFNKFAHRERLKSKLGHRECKGGLA